MTPEEAMAAIAEIIHAYDHPEYETVPYCTFCWAEAARVIERVDVVS